MRWIVLSRRRILRLLCAAAIVAAALGLVGVVLQARLRSYDRWQTHGFGLYLVYEGTACYMFLQDWRGRVAGEEAVRFDYKQGQWGIEKVDARGGLFEDLSTRAREKIAGFRTEHRLDRPHYMQQAMADRTSGIMYYGSAPRSWFTKLLAYGERKHLAFTSSGMGQWRALHSDRFHLVFRSADDPAPVLGIAVYREPSGALSYQLRRFEGLAEARRDWISAYPRTSFEWTMSHVSVWSERS